jgi:2-hydroxy-3-keto-5-methylthiopentenyl-1-phosphate phosphatase
MPQIKGPVRARDLRANVKDYGFEQGVLTTLEHMLDEHVSLRQHMRELTDLVSRCVDEVEKMVHIGDSMQTAIEQIKRERQGEDHGKES